MKVSLIDSRYGQLHQEKKLQKIRNNGLLHLKAKSKKSLILANHLNPIKFIYPFYFLTHEQFILILK